MLPRFLVPDLVSHAGEAVLPADEAHHLARVLRLRVGDAIVVFDGRGHETAATVASIARDRVGVTLTATPQLAAAPRVALTVIQSVLKSEAMDDVVRNCTMVGVTAIHPIVSARTTVKASVLPKMPERWRRIALASAKQSGRSMLPEIGAPVSFATWIDSDARKGDFLLIEPSIASGDAVMIRDLVDRPAPERARIVVGPEGGWTAEEVDQARRAGCVPLSLGRLTLRADAVPLVASAVLLTLWD
jgi:16S rRNA (uracil1498-N3)-methyltransferase